MIIAVIGHLVLDEIHTLDGSVYDSLGGIAFPISAFQAITREGDIIKPVFPIGTDAVEVYQRTFPRTTSLQHQWIYPVPERNTRVRLFHESLSHYNTRLVSSLPTISMSKVESAVGNADLVYINMMTGDDVVPPTLESIKAHTRATVFLDLHMVAYATAHDGARKLANVQNWKEWAIHADILQCNEQECARFIPGYSSEEARIKAVFDQSNVKIILVTRGEQGAEIYLRGGTSFHVAAVPQPNTVDPTGCGDVFGSVFAYFYTATNDARNAARLAAHAASFVAGIPGSSGISALRTALDAIR